MKLNWKVRIRNPQFWIGFIPALIAFAYTVLSLFGVTPGVSESSLLNAASTIVSALTALGVLVDPTTHGIEDSDRAMTYETPN